MKRRRAWRDAPWSSSRSRETMASWLIASGAEEEGAGEEAGFFRGGAESEESAARASAAALAPEFFILFFSLEFQKRSELLDGFVSLLCWKSESTRG